ncbi:hypothetical protein ACLB2K_002137 [Fragaria x ananassa]
MATYRALLSLKSSLDDPDSRLSALRLLNLSNNVFNRTFPPELSNLTNLRVLDLYNNNLTGVLPVSVEAEEQPDIFVAFLASAVPFFATRSISIQEEAQNAQEEAQQAREQARVAQEKILDYERRIQMLEKYVQSQPSGQEGQQLEVDG